jgi:hypothetical protein
VDEFTQPDLAAVVKREDSDRRSLSDVKIGTQRVDIELAEQLRFRASFKRFSITIDELPERGDNDPGFHHLPIS